MKRKKLVGLLPVLMVLSACGGSTSNYYQKEEDTFLEDTLAHEEIFGESQGQYLQKSVRNLTPVDSTTPLIAVQEQEYTSSKDGENYLAVRYVAAVKLASLSTTLEWSGSVYEDDGDLHKSYETLSAQKVYTTIYDGNSPLTIANFNNAQSPKTDYTHFVTYTIRKIPTDKTGYYVKASLSIGGVAATKIVATSVDLEKQVSFSPSDTGYFLQGTFGGEPDTIPQDGTTKGDDPSLNNASFTVSLEKDDSFVIIGNDTVNSKFIIYDSSSLSGGTSEFSFTDDNGNIKAKLTEDFILYASKDTNLYTGLPTGEYYNLFINSSLSPIENEVPAGWDDNAVFSNVVITEPNSTVIVKLNGNQVGGSLNIGYIGTYTIGLNDVNTLWKDGNTVSVSFTVDASARGDVYGWGGKIYIVGPFCDWSVTNPNKITLTHDHDNIWIGSVDWKYGTEYTYKVKADNDSGEWGDTGLDGKSNWFPGTNQTFTPSTGDTSINITWVAS